MQIDYTTILKGLPPKNCEKHRFSANTPTAKIAWQEGTPFRQVTAPPARQRGRWGAGKTGQIQTAGS